LGSGLGDLLRVAEFFNREAGRTGGREETLLERQAGDLLKK
jgi:hypothetical protein